MSVYGKSRGSSPVPGGWRRSVDAALDKVQLGPFRLFYSRSDDVLRLQVWRQGQNFYETVVEIDTDGEIRTEDVVKTLQDLTEYGR